jgi:predicted ribosome-associated RNA-binding protein Tma20
LSRKASTTVLRSVAKHSAPFSQAIVDLGGIHLIILVTREIDPVVKEIAAATIGHIAGHNPQLAQVAVDAGAVKAFLPLIKVCSHLCLCLNNQLWCGFSKRKTLT